MFISSRAAGGVDLSMCSNGSKARTGRISVQSRFGTWQCLAHPPAWPSCIIRNSGPPANSSAHDGCSLAVVLRELQKCHWPAPLLGVLVSGVVGWSRGIRKRFALPKTHATSC